MAETQLILDECRIEHGFALIIVNVDFSQSRARGSSGSPLPDRPGAESDRKCLKSFCESAGWSVTLEDDLETKQMKKLFKTICTEDQFTDFDAFICFISSHGNQGGINGVDGETISVEKIVSYFKNVGTLVDKPKLFFIQNCRGGNLDRGMEVQGCMQVDSGCESVQRPLPILIPKEADILVAYASTDGHAAFRNVNEGSWFIAELAQVLEGNAENMSLTDILAIVNARVAEKETHDNDGRRIKQMPCFTSSLRKSVYLKPTQAFSPPL